MNNIKPKIILDTDIGDDIDDAFALLLMLESEAFDVLGITTVFRNSRQRAHMCSYLIKKLNRNVPVYAGCDYPIISDPEKLNTDEIRAREKRDQYGMYQLPQWDPEMEKVPYESKNAVDFIIETVHKYPHEVILCGIGPLTNFAIALRKDPTIIPLIKEFRLMAGGVGINFAEWNMFCDPEAAYIVYNSSVPNTTIGIHTTCKTGLSNEDIEELKNSKSHAIATVYQMMMKWFEHYKFAGPVMHDPLAVATIIKPELCTFEKHSINIELGAERRGFMLVDDNNQALTNVSMDVDVRAFLDFFKGTILKGE